MLALANEALIAASGFVIDDGTLPPGALPLPHPVWRWLTALVRPVVLGNGGGGVARASPVAAFRRRATLASHWLSQSDHAAMLAAGDLALIKAVLCGALLSS